MKKLIALLMVFVMLIATTTMAFAKDYSSMSDQQLKEELDAIRNELVKRGFRAEKKSVICEQNEIQIYIDGDICIDKPSSWSSSSCILIPLVIINGSTHNIKLRLEDCSLNGWSSHGEIENSTTPAGKKSKATISFDIKGTDIKSLSDFSDMEFSIVAYDTDSFLNVFKAKRITIFAN